MLIKWGYCGRCITMSFQTLLQHKNLVVSGVIALGILLIGFSLAHKRVETSGEQVPVTQPTSDAQMVTDIDTDHDGLPDWKEKLYGSDINNPDTDGDRTKDGEEIRLGRNPVVPSTAKAGDPPNDKLSYFEDPRYATSSTDMAGLKKEFFARYLALGSRNIKETTFRDLIKKVDTKPFVPQHEIISLNISSDNSAAGTKAYVNAFGVVIKKHLNQRMDQSEDSVIQNSLTKDDADTRAELQLYAIAYKNFAKDLLVLQVPSALAKAHLLIINGYNGMGAGLLGLEKMAGNPIDGAAGYEAYTKYRLDVIDGYATIVYYIADQHITFTPIEPGYPFYWNTRGTKAPTP